MITKKIPIIVAYPIVSSLLMITFATYALGGSDEYQEDGIITSKSIELCDGRRIWFERNSYGELVEIATIEMSYDDFKIWRETIIEQYQYGDYTVDRDITVVEWQYSEMLNSLNYLIEAGYNLIFTKGLPQSIIGDINIQGRRYGICSYSGDDIVVDSFSITLSTDRVEEWLDIFMRFHSP